jgi:hypothetical protein
VPEVSEGMIAEVDERMSGMLDFGELLRVIEVQKAKAVAFNDEGDMVDAFVACGGRADKHGKGRKRTSMEEGIHVYITQKHSFSKGGKSSRLHFAEPTKKQESKAQKRALALPQRKRRCNIFHPLNFVSFVKIIRQPLE